MLLKYIIFILAINFALTHQRSIVEDIHSGIKIVGNLLGIKTASDVADLVSRAFSNDNNIRKSGGYTQENAENIIDPQNDISPTFGINTHLLTNVLRIFGLDGGKIGALVINGMIFLAQMIGTSLTAAFQRQPPPLPVTHQYHSAAYQQSNIDNEKQYRSLNSDSPLDWILDKESRLLPTEHLVDIRNKKLPEQLVEMVGKNEGENGIADCIKLLLCNTAPFIWKMQYAIEDKLVQQSDVEDDNDVINNVHRNDTTKDNVTNVNSKLSAFYKYLPNVTEFQLHSNACKKRYETCKIY